MGPLLVVEGQISPNPFSGLSPILVCLQVHLLVLDAAPQPFHEGGILKKCVNGQAVYPLSEQDGLKAQERRYTAYGKEKH